MKKQANKATKPAAESVERRVSAKGNSSTNPEVKTQSLIKSERGLERIRVAARRDKQLRFNNLVHHISAPLLEKAYGKLKRQASPGVDKMSWKDYGVGLERRLDKLNKDLHQGQYKAKPVLRKWIEKPDGSQRPLGVTSVEDKIVQQALVWVLEAIYEQDFYGFSYGFRPKRGCHKALDALYMAIKVKKVSFVLDADIKGFYDNINQQWLMRFIKHRVTDRRLIGLIKQILQAGTMEENQWSESKQGVPQGSVISPLLANIYLHYAFDQWAHQWRRRKARGEIYVIRYADDIISCFQYRGEGIAFRRAMEQRLEKFGLQLHPIKTKLIEFGRFARLNSKKQGKGKPETFDFLGFTHQCSNRRSDGKFAIRRTTIAKRQRAKLKEMSQWLKRNRTMPIQMQGRKLRMMLVGSMNYFGVPGNIKALNSLRTEICKSWYKQLRRRSQKARKLNWNKMRRIIQQWIPSMKITQPYPETRFHV